MCRIHVDIFVCGITNQGLAVLESALESFLMTLKQEDGSAEHTLST
jgi:hypothetical protein